MMTGFLPSYAGGVGMLRLASRVLVVCLMVAGHALAKEKLQVGDAPPDVLGKASSGERVKLSDYHGKIVIVSFWASWCAPCRKELSILANLQKAVSRDHLVVLAVNWRQDASVYRQITKTLKDIDLTLISDASGYVGDHYGVNAIPHMFIIGRDGRIAAIHVGYGESEIPILADEINALLATPAEP
jgi:peroxiredoxin